MAPFTIVSVKETETLDANSRPQKITRVTWRTERDGPFVLDVPTATFNADFAREQIQKKADELARLGA